MSWVKTKIDKGAKPDCPSCRAFFPPVAADAEAGDVAADQAHGVGGGGDDVDQGPSRADRVVNVRDAAAAFGDADASMRPQMM